MLEEWATKTAEKRKLDLPNEENKTELARAAEEQTTETAEEQEARHALRREKYRAIEQPRSGLLKHLRSGTLGLSDGDYKTELRQLRGILYLPDDGENKIGQLRGMKLYACPTERTRQTWS